MITIRHFHPFFLCWFQGIMLLVWSQRQDPQSHKYLFRNGPAMNVSDSQRNR